MSNEEIREIAALVVLYRQRQLRVWQWDDARKNYRRQITELVHDRHRLLRTALVIGRESRDTIGASVVPAAAAAFVLIDEHNSIPTAREFLAPVCPLDWGDPRLALRHALRQLPLAAPTYRTLGLILKAWGLWTTGSLARTITWTDGQPLPRVAGWPTVSLPGVPERPQ